MRANRRIVSATVWLTCLVVFPMLSFTVSVGADRVERSDGGESRHTGPATDQARLVAPHTFSQYFVPPFRLLSFTHSLTHLLAASPLRLFAALSCCVWCW